MRKTSVSVIAVMYFHRQIKLQELLSKKSIDSYPAQNRELFSPTINFFSFLPWETEVVMYNNKNMTECVGRHASSVGIYSCT
jgi:hypothetical protein